jgi:hypothetical protein
MSGIQAPQIVTIDTLNTFKQHLANDLALVSNSNDNINSIVQLNANLDENTNESHIIKVKNSAIFGTQHTADTLSNVFLAGCGNIATNHYQVILGTFNKVDPNARFIVGNGISDTSRNNAISVTTDCVTINELNIKKQNNTICLQSEFPISINNIIFDQNNVDAAIAGIAEINTWKNNLVQTLDYIAADAATKALSVTAGQELQRQINALETSTSTNGLQAQIDALKQQISYLVSCLTVDKITNGDQDYYAVGVADFAFDADTKFKVADVTVD